MVILGDLGCVHLVIKVEGSMGKACPLRPEVAEGQILNWILSSKYRHG